MSMNGLDNEPTNNAPERSFASPDRPQVFAYRFRVGVEDLHNKYGNLTARGFSYADGVSRRVVRKIAREAARNFTVSPRPA